MPFLEIRPPTGKEKRNTGKETPNLPFCISPLLTVGFLVAGTSTTTTEPLPPRAPRPETFVGVTQDGRLVVVDVATGEEIRELAEPLKGKRVVQLSATAFGGGVSEILYTLIPLMRDVGLEVEWQVIYGREEFFNSTKLMHNALQGAPQDLTEEQWATWFQYNEMNARELSRGWDVCLVHDPQPAAMLSLAPEKAKA